MMVVMYKLFKITATDMQDDINPVYLAGLTNEDDVVNTHYIKQVS